MAQSAALGMVSWETQLEAVVAIWGSAEALDHSALWEEEPLPLCWEAPPLAAALGPYQPERCALLFTIHSPFNLNALPPFNQSRHSS